MLRWCCLDGVKSSCFLLSEFGFCKFMYIYTLDDLQNIFRRISGLNIITFHNFGHFWFHGTTVGSPLDISRIAVNGVVCHHMYSHVEW